MIKQDGAYHCMSMSIQTHIIRTFDPFLESHLTVEETFLRSNVRRQPFLQGRSEKDGQAQIIHQHINPLPLILQITTSSHNKLIRPKTATYQKLNYYQPISDKIQLFNTHSVLYTAKQEKRSAVNIECACLSLLKFLASSPFIRLNNPIILNKQQCLI